MKTLLYLYIIYQKFRIKNNNQKFQIILIIWHFNAEPKKVLRYIL